MTFRALHSTVAAVAAVLALGASLAGCDEARSGHAFRLPDGNVAAGKQAFVDLRCYVCHPVRGVDAAFQGTPAATVPLGGRVTRVKSYGELVTSIINPSHKIVLRAPQAPPPPDAQSAMEFARLNDHLTVQQLIDLVAFLQGTYEVVPPRYDPYVYVYP